MNKPKQILGISSAKTQKGEVLGFLTGIAYLSPADESGVINVCPWAGNCKKVCLNTAGRGAFNSVQIARKRKTVFWKENPAEFLETVRKDIVRLVKKANRMGMTPCIRLNGTSDIRFHEKITSTGKTLMEEFPNQFYDYTKDIVKMRKYLSNQLPKNYHLTFSYDGETNWKNCKEVLDNGGHVAVVFRNENFPSSWRGYPVIDGDTHDLRFLDKEGAAIVALKAKGKAKKDNSGFVVDCVEYGV